MGRSTAKDVLQTFIAGISDFDHLPECESSFS